MNSRRMRMLLNCLVAVALIAGMLPWTPVWASLPTGTDKIEKGLLDKVLASPGGQYDVIVSMQPGKSAESKGAVEKEGGKHRHSLPIIGGSSASLSGKAILALARNPNVARVFEDAPVQLMGDVYSIDAKTVNAPDVWYRYGYTGKGVGVAVLDSGVAPHRDLTYPSNRLIASVDTVGNTDGSMMSAADPGGHGTHVAGIIAGNGYSDDGHYKGIAPNASIISVKVTNNSGYASYSSVIYGIQWVVRHRSQYNIRVMNLSLGAPVTRSYRDDPLAGALEVAWFSGIFVVAAAGNGGPDSGTITTPGNDPYVVTVGALDDMGTSERRDDVVAYFSAHGPTAIDNLQKPDVLAPGRRVISLRSVGSYLDQLLPDRVFDYSYFRLSGTSMAAPVVSGIAALLIEKNSKLTPNQIKYIITRSALAMNYDANTAGAGSANALMAIQYGNVDNANRGAVPSDFFAKTILSLAKGAPLTWRDPYYMGRNWADYTWETLPWDSYTWENFSWESVDWALASWSTYTWEDFTWEDFTWEDYTWEDYTWENSWSAEILD